jgi:Fe-Mn family superoxide dismutase
MAYELPPLPYGYNALEPYYDEQTVRLHHDKHHAAYVAGLNKAEDELGSARAKGDYALVKHWERELAFHGSGHALHTLFWENMAAGGGSPEGELAARIVQDFGSLEAFKAQFTAAAVAVEGSGWCLLAWVPAFGKLSLLQVEKHQDLTVWGAVPLLIVDVWEHAYYLKYQNRRAEWIGQWWNIVNWADVAHRYARLAR